MEIRLPKSIFDEVLAATGSEALKADQLLQSMVLNRARNPQFIVINGSKLERKTLKAIYDLTKDKDNEYANSIEFLWNAIKNPSGTLIKRVADVHPALQAYLDSGKIKNYLFSRGAFKAVLPYLVTHIEKQTEVRRYSSGTTDTITVTLAYAEGTNAESENIIINPHMLTRIYEDSGIENKVVMRTYREGGDSYEYQVDATSEVGVSVEALLRYFGYYLETEELHLLYEKQMKRYYEFIKRYGQQFRVRGTGESVGGGSWWDAGTQPMLVEGKPARCIMNTIPSALFPADENHDNAPGSKGSRRYRRYRDNEDDNDSGQSTVPSDPLKVREAFNQLTPELLHIQTKVMFGKDTPKEGKDEIVPIHPKLKVFHLHKMRDYWVHIQNLAAYIYRDDIQDQLVIPVEIKELTEMLVASSAEESEDIVEDKSQSTVIAAIGDPGLGKTLMAEVMSEACRKPLYKVQAAQLGLDATTLEINLRRILNQAQRWNAVLMVDEANAYIHSRGSDVAQNAIVGVFLRLLEYYRGILILTTNMTSVNGEEGFDIDDAILSRCKAVFRFELPTKTDAFKIWQLQARLLKVNTYDDKGKPVSINLQDTLIHQLVEEYQISGRSIRHLLSLTWPWSKVKKEPLAFKHFETCIKFTPMGQKERFKKAKVTPSLKAAG